MQGACELLLFGEDYFGYAVGGVFEFGVGEGHLVADGGDHLVEEGLLLAEEAAVADASAHDLAEDVAAAFVRGQDAVGDEEGGAAGVVCDDAQAGGLFCVADAGFGERHVYACEFRGLGDKRGEEVGLVVGEDALEHAGDALEAHAGVDGGLGEGCEGGGASGVDGAVELHEDEVPDLHVAWASSGERACRIPLGLCSPASWPKS